MDYNHSTKYKKYLRSKEWRKKRKEVLELYGNMCMMCGKFSKHLHIHHLNYENLGNESLSDLIPLCRKCHKLLHGVF